MLTRYNQARNSTSQETKYPYLVRALLRLLRRALPHNVFGSTANAINSDIRFGASVVEQLTTEGEKELPIFLNSGEFLQFSVLKGDLKISVVLCDQAGTQLVEYFSHSYEPAEISAVAESTGVFVVKVRSLESRGRNDQVLLSLQSIRRATAEDVKDSIATLSFADASRFSAEWTEGSLRNGIDKYAEAARSAASPRIAAAALRKAGETHFVLGDYRQALNYYERAATRSKKAGEQPEAVDATAHAARLHSLLGNNDRAQQQLDEAWCFYSNRNDRNDGLVFKHGFAQTLNHLGEISYSKGDLIRAYNYFEQAAGLFTEIKDRNGRARCLLFRGYITDAIGELDRAMSLFDEALELYRDTGNRAGEGLAITARGITHSLERKDEEGIKLHREARSIFQTIGDLQSEAITLNAVGQAYQNLNENSLALGYYKQAQKLFEQNGTRDFLPVSIYQIASLYKEKADFETALSYYEDCARLSHANKKNRMEAYALNEIATIYAMQGDHAKALRQYLKVLRFHGSIHDRRGQAFALNNIGDLYLSLGRTHEALATYERALPLSEQASERGIEITTRYNIARASRDSGDLGEAQFHIEQSLEMIEALRANVASPGYRSSYFSGLRKHYDLYIDILMQLDHQQPGEGYAEKALLASESARARALLELLVEAGADIRQDIDPALLQRERELQGLLRAHARYRMELSVSSKDNSVEGTVNQEIDRLKAEYESLQAQVRHQSSRYQALSHAKPLTVMEIQAQLGADDILLEYALGEERSYLWALTTHSLHGYELKSRSILEGAAFDVYRLMTARQGTGEEIDADVEASDKQYYEKAHALSLLLLEPVVGVLAKKRLIVVAEGLLQSLPFDALPHPVRSRSPGRSADDAALLISDHEFVSLPSISTLAAIRSEGKQPTSAEGVVAVFADPVFSRNDERVQRSSKQRQSAQWRNGSEQTAFRKLEHVTRGVSLHRLTHASDEADLILAAASGDAWVLTGFEASRENVMSDQVSQYPILHFATHGFVNTVHPELSGIVLSMIKPDGSAVDGFLQLHDVFNLKLSAELTVLSACNTGLGKDVRGEGVIGLTRALMFAGSRSVVATLWKVDDRATAVLMGHFYKSMLQDGLPPAAALRFAKEQMRKERDWASPFFWAGFVLQGEYYRAPRTAEALGVS